MLSPEGFTLKTQSVAGREAWVLEFSTIFNRQRVAKTLITCEPDYRDSGLLRTWALPVTQGLGKVGGKDTAPSQILQR